MLTAVGYDYCEFQVQFQERHINFYVVSPYVLG